MMVAVNSYKLLFKHHWFFSTGIAPCSYQV
uniref:Uncharacterized protein n=1 Tax=Bacteriophage sp. TaxID=38018 RepID=A0A8D9UIU0_9VIRU|nr:MAG TPA: hypothetical protein [Bacteriophage sp.]